MSRRSLFACLPAVALGVAALIAVLLGRTYRMGSLTAMGPGFLPVAVGVLLLILAGLLLVLVLRPQDAAASTEPVPAPVMWRPLLLSSASVLIWALTVNRLGYLPSSALLLLLAFFAMPGARWLPTLLSTAAVLAFGYIIFIWLLGMPLPVIGN